MGLTIHYQLATKGDEADARKIVQQLRQAALDLPFQHVGEIVEFRGDQCDWNQRADDDPYRWLLIQARTHIAVPVSPLEKRQGVTCQLDVRPQRVIAFETEPGDGCESANFGLCQFPKSLTNGGETASPDRFQNVVTSTGTDLLCFAAPYIWSMPLLARPSASGCGQRHHGGCQRCK